VEEVTQYLWFSE